MEQQDREPMDFEEMVQKAVEKEDKAGLRLSTIAWDLDAHCPRDHRPSNSTVLKVQTQEKISKKSKPKESRPKKAKLAKGKNSVLLCSKFIEPGTTSLTDKRREYFEKKKKKRDRKNNTPATGDNVNVVEVGKKKKQDD